MFLVSAICDGYGYLLFQRCRRGLRRSLRPFQAIWTPMQSRMKAMTRRIPWAVDGEMARVIRGA